MIKEHRLKISEGVKKNLPRTAFKKGRKHTEEFKENLSKRMSGRIVSKETRKKIGKRNKVIMKEKWKSGNISKATRDNLFKSGDNRIGKETQFEKGHMPWIKGKTHSKETRKIMSNVLSEQYKEGTRVPPMLGKKHSEETKETIRVKKIGSKLSIKTRKKLSRSLKGSKSYLWKGGITPISTLKRHNSDWKIWRESIFKRDNFTCQNKRCVYCKNIKGVMLHPHHKIPVAKDQSLMYEVSNGITYCADYHIKFGGLHKNIK